MQTLPLSAAVILKNCREIRMQKPEDENDVEFVLYGNVNFLNMPPLDWVF